MAFWGVEIKPGKPYTHQYDDMRGRLHISQATLGTGSSTDKSLLQCNVGDKSPVLLCSLLPDKTESCPLSLEFEEDDDVVFSVVGPRSIHLTGFYLGVVQDFGGDDDETDSYGEDIGETETEESTDYDTEDEDEYDEDFIDDGDVEVFPPSPVPNSGVVIEEILDDEKPTVANGSQKHPKKKSQLRDSDNDDSSQRQIVVKGSTSAQFLESEDEDGFPISPRSKIKSSVNNLEAEKEKTDKKSDKESKKKKTQDDGNQVTGLKRKSSTAVEDDEPVRGAGQPCDASVPSSVVGLEKGVGTKKKKKEQAKEGRALEAANDDKNDEPKGDKMQSEQKHQDKSLDMDEENTAAAVAAETPSEEKKGRKKKKNKKNKKSKTQETAVDVVKEEPSLAVDEKKASIMGSEGKKVEAKASHVRTFSNGLVIEELAMGKPDGKRASPGNKVAVHYIGKLKKNGKIFDSNIGRAPFRFRLGVGQVIKGWDVGLNGMRIGDKRRLTIPPSMGYGSQGAGGQIPPNSWLVFDVELVDVRG
ncbi:PREDICTED: peptidyl-prolyl cis-trans isomerase FKBP53 [Nelumbo nucifera]|uniref:peptidylprolyl isomerase n=2 Tax=Nelumbo nucifera TaxID=4432 RepID=A0A1U8B668_NELNU|nr:PREDICTED: peptidyl-prolyl cis-trans isomerase FKBP53 [Nelumbo nucifera]DAD33747.1 TPA_asm: hypothetical protein HUJ06_012598 [Nelumbo nucifera]